MLSSDIVTEFRGRSEEIRVRTLSFSEFLSAFDGTEEQAWDIYTLYGGLPEVVSMRTDEKKTDYLQNLVAKTYQKDITDRYRIRYPTALNNVFDVLCSSTGSLTNPVKLRNAMKSKEYVAIDDETVSTYIGYLTDVFLFERSYKYDVKGKSYLDTPLKYYATDIGLRNAELDFKQNEITHITENIIYNRA